MSVLDLVAAVRNVIGVDVQAWDAQLDDIAALDVTQNENFIVSDGANWLQKTVAQVLEILGLTPAFGSLYVHEGAINVDISAVGQGVYVKITGLTTGELSNVTINSDALNAGVIGRYGVYWHISGDSQGNNKDYEVDVFLNGVEQPDGSARREYGGAGSLGNMAGTGIINVTNVSHDIDLRVKEIGAGAGTDFDIFNAGFHIERLGP